MGILCSFSVNYLNKHFSRCLDTSCPSGCHPTETYNGIPPAQPESAENREQIYQVLASTSKPQRSGSLMNNLVQLGNSSSSSSSVESAASRKDSVPNTTIVDVTQEQKGRNVMDALLGMFAKVNAHPIPKTGNPPEESVLEEHEYIHDPSLEEIVLTQDQFSIWTNSVLDEGPSEFMETDTLPDDGPSGGEPFSIPVSTKGGRLLCMDGGGIRGLILVQLLLEIEKLSQTPVHHMFDWVAGTSTGGILALGLGSGKTMRQCMCLYLRMKDQAFVGSRPYASDNLEALLKESLGEYTVMTDIKHPKIMVTGVMADRKPVDLHLFRNYTCASDILGIVTPTSECKNKSSEKFIERSPSPPPIRPPSSSTSPSRRPIDLASSSSDRRCPIVLQVNSKPYSTVFFGTALFHTLFTLLCLAEHSDDSSTAV